MPKSVSVRSGQVEFLKLNLQRREYRDIYQWLLALKWPEFAALIAGIYIILNLVFAEFYALAGGSIAGLRSGSYVDAFFSVSKRSPPSAMAIGIRKHFMVTS
jgi:hypothetical protein